MSFNNLETVQTEQITANNSITKRERKALKVIYSHRGKRMVYETYLRTEPEMAEKYVKFISKNPWIVYIKWDDKRQKFVA